MNHKTIEIGKILRELFKLSICFFVGICIFTALLFIVSAIPNEEVEENQNEALAILEGEGDHPMYAFSSDAAMADNFTDKVIITQMTNSNDSIIKSAMHETYTRYWHGYSVFIRPLLTTFSLYQIRYMLMITFFVLFGCSTALIANKIGFITALSYMISIAMVYMNVIATSLQYAPMFLLSFISICIIMIWPNLVRKNHMIFFLAIGMITNYIDFLTVPIISLGYSLIVFVLYNLKENRDDNSISLTIIDTIVWFLGYGMTWLSKWVVASLILKRDAIADAVTAILFRTQGNEEYPLDYSGTFSTNIEKMFASQGKEPVILLAILVIIAIIVSVIFHKKMDRQGMLGLICVAAIGISPYVWYFVLSNHSMIHYFFTYRAQAITIFACLSIIIYQTDWDRLHSLIVKQKI